MEMSNFGGRHLGFFPKGLAYDFGSKFKISCNLVDKMDPEMMSGDVFG